MVSSKDVKVGAFVLAGLTAMGAVIFLIGDERQLFHSKVKYATEFEDVQGLRRGSPVRMGGVDIGTVVGVDYASAANDKNIHVRMSISVDDARRIRKDSVATIEGKGLLGDKMIVVTVGTPGQPQLPEGREIPSRAAEDMSKLIGSHQQHLGSGREGGDQLGARHQFALGREVSGRYPQFTGIARAHFGFGRSRRRLRREIAARSGGGRAPVAADEQFAANVGAS